MNETTKSNGNASLSEKVTAYKVIARNSLRMALISPRLSKVSGYEDNLKYLAESKAKTDHAVVVQKYEISKLDTDHPDYNEHKTEKENTVKHLTERLEYLEKEVEETNKLITEQKEAIAKIENGETKVSLDALNDLVQEMIRKDATNKVATS